MITIFVYNSKERGTVVVATTPRSLIVNPHICRIEIAELIVSIGKGGVEIVGTIGNAHCYLIARIERLRFHSKPAVDLLGLSATQAVL